MKSPLDWMDVQIAAMYSTDERGRLLDFGGPSGEPAPRCFVGRTPEGNRWRLRNDVPAETARALDAICRAVPVVSDLETPPAWADGIRRVLERDAPIEFEYRGPAFRFPDLIEPPQKAVEITGANAALLETWFPELVSTLLARLPCFGSVADGCCVSVCHCATGPGPAVEAGVDTARGYRRCGYAADAVRAWARAVRASGRVPLYSTQWPNDGSRGVARRLGLVCYGEDLHMR